MLTLSLVTCLLESSLLSLQNGRRIRSTISMTVLNPCTILFILWCVCTCMYLHLQVQVCEYMHVDVYTCGSLKLMPEIIVDHSFHLTLWVSVLCLSQSSSIWPLLLVSLFMGLGVACCCFLILKWYLVAILTGCLRGSLTFEFWGSHLYLFF